MRRGTASALLLLALTAFPAVAQQPAQKRNITLKDMLALSTYGGYQLSPDGGKVLFTRAERDLKDYSTVSHIWLHELEGGRTYQLTSSARGESNPRFLPDGRIAFTSNRDTRNAWYVISPNGGEAVKLVEGDSLPTGGSFSKDGKFLLYTEQTERTDKKEWDDKVKKKDDGYFAEKKLTYTHIWTYDLAAKKKKQITTGNTDNQGAAFSPDAKWIAFTSNRTGTTARDANWSNNSDIFLVSADGGEPRQLTTNAGPDNGPVWSPDGTMIAYTSSDYKNNSADQSDLKVIRIDGGETVNITKKIDYSVSNIEWARDGRAIYFSTAEGLTNKLYKVKIDGMGELLPISFGDKFVFGDFSSTDDGSKWLVTGATLDQPGIVYLTSADGAQPKRIFQEHDRIRDFNVARSEAITWKGADNWDIEGVLTYPLNYQPGQR
ncbi:MAG: TolB family protein, partial [Longimicrobiales bacterium]